MSVSSRVISARGLSYILGVATVLVSCTSLGCHRSETVSKVANEGGLWLRMTQEERTTVLESFASGYLLGADDACMVVEREAGRHSDVEKDFAAKDMSVTQACMNGMHKFSHLGRNNPEDGWHFYSALITEFYQENGDMRHVPIRELMLDLADGGPTGSREFREYVRARNVPGA